MNGISVPVDQLKPLLQDGPIKAVLVVECTFPAQPGAFFLIALDIAVFVQYLQWRRIPAAVIRKDSPYMYILEDLQLS